MSGVTAKHRQTKCPHCGGELEDDYITQEEIDMDYLWDCPDCGKEVSVKEWLGEA